MTENKTSASNILLQMVTASTTSVITGSTTLPVDNTIPQNTEGDQAITLAITPISATSTLLIEFTSQTRGTANMSSGGIALFQDSTAGSLAATDRRGTADSTLVYSMTSGTTSSTTFKIRIGKNEGTALYMNATNTGTALMGGVMYAFISIKEIL